MKPISCSIIGLGPVGSILAVMLKKAGCEVSLCVANDVKREKILAEGIILENVLQEKASFEQVYSSLESLIEKNPDFLIVATKSYQVPGLVERLSMLSPERTILISAQNGIDVEEMLVEKAGASATLRMVINFAGTLVAPNTIKVNFFQPPNYIGSINDAISEKAEELAKLLSAAGLLTEANNSGDLRVRVWEKTILNAALSPLCGISRLTMSEAVSDPDTRELIEQIILEGIDVARKEKIIFPDDFLQYCMKYLEKGGDHFPSLALDLIHNRPTEIDYFNGKIVEYGRKHNTHTSLNLSFYNVVKAMTNKNLIARVPGKEAGIGKKILEKGLLVKGGAAGNKDCYLGIDLGSAYTKYTVTDETGQQLFRYVLHTLSADSVAQKNVLQAIQNHFRIQKSCATGYGRKHFESCDMVKTEINCAAAAVSFYYPGEKNIIDIGGEDIKIIRCGKDNSVEHFYMNDKCAAGTGSFLSEIAERANIAVDEMSTLAAHSRYDKPLNSFCTVFAKTEIMNWIFEGMTREDIARGIYLSIAGKIAKMRLDPGIPVYMIGGVASYHPYLKEILNELLKKDISIVDNSQYAVSFGAALLAQQSEKHNRGPVIHSSQVSNS